MAAQLYRASCGAGCPLALSEDLYHAAYFLTPDNVTWIVTDIEQRCKELCSIINAVDWVDCGQFKELSHPVAVAFAAARGWCLIDGKKVILDDVAYAGPIELTDDIWGRLEFFSRKTYVPESAVSRMQGAGGGADIE